MESNKRINLGTKLINRKKKKLSNTPLKKIIENYTGRKFLISEVYQVKKDKIEER